MPGVPDALLGLVPLAGQDAALLLDLHADDGLLVKPRHASSLSCYTRTLVTLTPVEVSHDDGDGQGDAQHAADGAQRPHELAGGSERRHVPVPGARHRDDRPVQRLVCHT